MAEKKLLVVHQWEFEGYSKGKMLVAEVVDQME